MMTSLRNNWMVFLAVLLCGVNLGQPCSDKFFIVNKSTNKCIDVGGYPGVSNGANVQTWDCELNNEATDQLWYFDSQHRLVSAASGKCLDVRGYRSSSNGANIQLYTCEDPDWANTDHTWEFRYQHGSNYFSIHNLNTGKCVDVRGWSDGGNGNNVQQWSCENYHQRNTDHYWFMVFLE